MRKTVFVFVCFFIFYSVNAKGWLDQYSYFIEHKDKVVEGSDKVIQPELKLKFLDKQCRKISHLNLDRQCRAKTIYDSFIFRFIQAVYKKIHFNQLYYSNSQSLNDWLKLNNQQTFTNKDIIAYCSYRTEIGYSSSTPQVYQQYINTVITIGSPTPIHDYQDIDMDKFRKNITQANKKLPNLPSLKKLKKIADTNDDIKLYKEAKKITDAELILIEHVKCKELSDLIKKIKTPNKTKESSKNPENQKNALGYERLREEV